MGEEERGDLFSERGIPLCAEDEDLGGDEDHFETRPRKVGKLGFAFLEGIRDFDYTDVRCLAVSANEVVEAKGNDLYDQGLFELLVVISGFSAGSSEAPVVCRVFIPGPNVTLETVMRRDEDEIDNDPMRRYRGYSDEWHILRETDISSKVSNEQTTGASEVSRGQPFFIPKDPKFLSNLKFSFTS